MEFEGFGTGLAMMGASSQAIASSWLARPATEVAPDLVGCVLVRQFPNGTVQRGMIVEVEAYGPGDPACHAYRKRTPRNAVMFGPAGFSYVYFIYGMYHCLNVVTDQDGIPSAVLLRALALDQSLNGEGRSPKVWSRVAAGPGKLCRQLEIDKTLNERRLAVGEPLWLELRSPAFQTALDCQREMLVQTTRIGISQGADLPWRWYLQGSAAVSKTIQSTT